MKLNSRLSHGKLPGQTKVSLQNGFVARLGQEYKPENTY